ncbi:MAG: hypothetical protein E7585_05125 [Ruminococcaceae bacterium]|nr:hypothetical protein [Oscillospiraceae bacterium]
MKKSILCLLMALCLCLCMILASCKPEPEPEPLPEQEKQGQVHQTPDTSASVDPIMPNEQVGTDTPRY